MFCGVQSHRNAPRVDSYDRAVEALDKASCTPKQGRKREAKAMGYPLGKHSKSVTWVREVENNGIAFRLYDTDVITWYPGDDVAIDNFGTATTSTFAGRFLPAGVYLTHPTVQHGREGGFTMIGFRTENRGAWWDSHLCQSSLALFQRQDNDVWMPDVRTLATITYPEKVDPKATREFNKRYNLADFTNWLFAAHNHIEMTHVGYDLHDCLDALERRDWREAAVRLPLVEIGAGFGNADRIKPLNIDTSYGYAVTMSSIDRLKVAMWFDNDLITTRDVTTIPRREHENAMKRVRELARLGCHVRGWGPQW